MSGLSKFTNLNEPLLFNLAFDVALTLRGVTFYGTDFSSDFSGVFITISLPVAVFFKKDRSGVKAVGDTCKGCHELILVVFFDSSRSWWPQVSNELRLLNMTGFGLILDVRGGCSQGTHADGEVGVVTALNL